MVINASKLSGTLSDAIFEAMVDVIPTIAVIADQNVILRASRHGGAIVGWDPPDVEGLTIADFYAKVPVLDADRRPVAVQDTPISRALRGEYVSNWEGYVMHRRGEPVGATVSAAPLLARDGGVIGAITAAMDVRKYKDAEQELRDLVNQKSALYDELAHRVKNHMQVMSTMVGIETRTAVESIAEKLTKRLKGLSAIYESLNRVGDHSASELIEQIAGVYRTEAIDVKVTVPKR